MGYGGTLECVCVGSGIDLGYRSGTSGGLLDQVDSKLPLQSSVVHCIISD